MNIIINISKKSATIMVAGGLPLEKICFSLYYLVYYNFHNSKKDK